MSDRYNRLKAALKEANDADFIVRDMCAFVIAQFPKDMRYTFRLDDYPELKKQVEDCDGDIDKELLASGRTRSRERAALSAQQLREDPNTLGQMCDAVMSVLY